MNRKTRNERSAFTIMFVSGLFLLSFVVILVMFTSLGVEDPSGGIGNTPDLSAQIALQQTQISMQITLTAMAGGVPTMPLVTIPPITLPPPITETPFITPSPVIAIPPPTIALTPGQINFFDDFHNDSPLWQKTGEWILANEQPVFTGRPRCSGRLLTGAVNWDNYAIEFDKLTQKGWQLLFGYKDEQNYFYMDYIVGSTDNTYIHEFYNSNNARVNTSERGYIPNQKARLQVRGNTMKFYSINAYGDENLIYDMQLARPLNGQVGFQTCNTSEPVLDNFRVYSIP